MEWNSWLHHPYDPGFPPEEGRAPEDPQYSDLGNIGANMFLGWEDVKKQQFYL